MNNRIVRIGLAAMAVAVLAFIGIDLLAGRGTGARLTPSSAQAQSAGNTPPDPFVGTWQMHSYYPEYTGLRLVISKHDGRYWVLSASPDLTNHTWEAFTRQGEQISGVYHDVDPITGKVHGAEVVQLSVDKAPGQLRFRSDGGRWNLRHATMTKVSDSTATPAPAPSGSGDPFVGTWRVNSGDPRLPGQRFIIREHDGQYTLFEGLPGTTRYDRGEVVTRQGDQLSVDQVALTENGRLIDAWWTTLSVTEMPDQLRYRYDGTDLRGILHATMTRVSDSTATATPAP
jgi:hypothetical protein